MKPLEHRVVAITGASSGIGLATARRCAAAGASVFLGARREARLDALAAEIRESGGEARAHRVDVTRPDEAKGFVEAAPEWTGRLDALVNCAGVELVGGAAHADPALWRRMVDVNLLGSLYCCRAALPAMLSKGQGDLVNISSVAGRLPSLGGAAYSGTKAGLNGFSEALRQEVCAAGIRVIVVEPGFAETELHGHTPDPTAREALRRIGERIGEVLRAEDVAESIAFALAQPQRVSLNEILIRPTAQRV